MGRGSGSVEQEEDQTKKFEGLRTLTSVVWDDRLKPFIANNPFLIGLFSAMILFWMFETPIGRIWDASTSSYPIINNNPVIMISIGVLLPYSIYWKGGGNWVEGVSVVFYDIILPTYNSVCYILGKTGKWAGRQLRKFLNSASARFWRGLKAGLSNGRYWVDTTIIGLFPKISIPKLVALVATGGISLGAILEKYQLLPLLEWLQALPFQ